MDMASTSFSLQSQFESSQKTDTVFMEGFDLDDMCFDFGERHENNCCWKLFEHINPRRLVARFRRYPSTVNFLTEEDIDSDCRRVLRLLKDEKRQGVNVNMGDPESRPGPILHVTDNSTDSLLSGEYSTENGYTEEENTAGGKGFSLLQFLTNLNPWKWIVKAWRHDRRN